MKAIVFPLLLLCMYHGSFAQTTPLSAPPSVYQGKFEYTLETQARPEAIWRIWTDVEGWPKWDSGLRAASVMGPFSENCKGLLTPDKGPKSRFRIVDLQPGKTYTLLVPLPFGSLRVKRFWDSTPDGKTRFTHQVTFTGFARVLFRSTAKRYAALLPEVMQKIEALALQTPELN